VTEILAQAEKRASQMIEEAKASAKVEGDRLVAGAEQILKREVDAKAHADLIAAVQKQL